MQADREPPPPEPDEFDRMLIELISGRAGPARYRELSAAERASRAAAVQARKAAATRRGPRLGLRRRLLGWGMRVASVLLVLGLIAYVVYTVEFPAPPTTRGAIRPSPGNATSSQPAPGQPGTISASDPFHGKAAESYANGAVGIKPPPARPVAGHTAAQVGAAYASVKRLLVAAELDPATLHGRRPRAFIRLLTPRQRARFLRGLDRPGIDANGASRSTRSWLTSFAPGTAFVGSVVKVHGRMTATTVSERGRPVLRVEFNYLFVYPVQRPGRPQTRTRVVVHVRGNVDFARWSSAAGPLQPWWRSVGSAIAGARCDMPDGLVHPEFPGGPPDPVSPSGSPVNPYQLDLPATPGKCFATTGT